MVKNLLVKKLNGIVFLFLIIILTGFTSNAQVRQLQLEKLRVALKEIESNYIENLDDEKLVEDAIRGILRELDPHSAYLSADDLRRANEPLEGSFEGIGIQFNLINDTIIVVSPIPGGPSEKVGIMPGDRIVKINGETAHGSQISNQYVQDKLRGERGSKVDVAVYRAGAKDLLDFTITRDRIPIFSVDAAFMATPEIGYIKINRFARTTMREYIEASTRLRQQGMKHLILDLNYNSGGYMNIAIGLADQFLDNNKLIVYTEGHASARQEYNSTFRGNFIEGKLVIMINEGSASASEIVSGAVQDWDRGLIVGRRSFGKGLVQSPIELPDGSAIRLTIAAYHTPTGRSIQKPYDEGAEEYYKDLSERLSSGELVSPDNITFPDSLKYYTKNNKRAVFGGGGIMPDFFIPIDTTRMSDFYSRLIRRGVMNHFGIEYTNRYRTELLNQYPDLNAFIDAFDVDAALFNELLDYAAENDLVADESDYENVADIMKTQLKALIARNLFDFAAYTQVIMQNDDAFRMAISIIEDDTFDELNILY